MLTEFYHLMNNHQNVTIQLPIHVSAGVLLFLLIALNKMDIIGEKYFSLFIIYLIYTFVVELYRKKAEPIKNWAYAFLGQIYITLPIALLTYIGFYRITYLSFLLLSLFVFIWLNDTGAYLVGSRIGKHRLFERISPKKSWEGFWGGILFAILGGIVFSQFFNELNLYEWIGFATITALFSTWGDLCESLIKRSIGVKDSGNLLPGHGGMLDRFDSVLMACPAALLYLMLIQ